MQLGSADIGQALSSANSFGESFEAVFPDGFESRAILAPGGVSVLVGRHAEFGPDSISDLADAVDTRLPTRFGEWNQGDNIESTDPRMDTSMPGDVYALESGSREPQHSLRNVDQRCREREYRAMVILVAVRVQDMGRSGIDGGLHPPQRARTPAFRNIRHAHNPFGHRFSRTILHSGPLDAARVH